MQAAFDRKRAVIGAAVTALILVGVAWAVYDERQLFVDTIRKMSPESLAASFIFGLFAVGTGLPTWREVLKGFGVEIPLRPCAQVFFVSQLGKYVPGSVWPMVMQMEAGRARGYNRRTMIGANLATIAITCCVGIAVACGLLPFYDSAALTRYWWALFALPFLVAVLHPRALPILLDRALALLRRPPLDGRLDPRAELRACGWALASWIGFGAQLAVLVVAVGGGGFSTFMLCTGAVALAIPLGILFVPAPAGAGIREVILTLVLTTLLSTGGALAVVVASRVVLIACDLSLAGLGVGVGRTRAARVA